MRNAANCVNCGYNTKFRIMLPRTVGPISRKQQHHHRVPQCVVTLGTITIKSGGVGTTLSRRWRKSGEGGVSYRLGTSLGQTERMQETSSRVFLKPSPTYGLLPVYAVGSSGRQRNERTDVPSAIFPKTGTNKVPAGGESGHPATSFPLREIRSLGV